MGSDCGNEADCEWLTLAEHWLTQRSFADLKWGEARKGRRSFRSRSCRRALAYSGDAHGEHPLPRRLGEKESRGVAESNPERARG